MDKLVANVASKLTLTQRNELNRISKEINLTKSELIRKLINEYLHKIIKK